MDTRIQIRSVRSRSFLTNALVLVMLLAGQAIAPPQATASNPPVDVTGAVTEERIASEGDCEIWTLLLWPALPGAISYTIDMHDSWGYSFVATSLRTHTTTLSVAFPQSAKDSIDMRSPIRAARATALEGTTTSRATRS